ncbi:MAG: GAF domain-containing protein, partial [Nocardioidaceae bacterium]
DPDTNSPPHLHEHRDVLQMRREHPLAPYVPVLQELLVDDDPSAQHVMVITNGEGDVLWMQGNESVERGAERLELVEGARWSEAGAGTNAIGTSIWAGRAMQVFSAEHFVRSLHAWTCSAAPIHDPETGSLLGVIDVSGPYRTLHPDTLALVKSAARVVEEMMRSRRQGLDERARLRAASKLHGFTGDAWVISPSGRIIHQTTAVVRQRVQPRRRTSGMWELPDGGLAEPEPLDDYTLLRVPNHPRKRPGHLRLRFLGSEPPFVELGGRRLTVTLRRAEILALLAASPNGMSADALTMQLYGEEGNPTTTRAELHRVRQILGERILAKPYRLTAPFTADFLEVRELVLRGKTEAALDLYTGQLLPGSGSLAVEMLRDELHVMMRKAVIQDSGAALGTWVDSVHGTDDQEAIAALLDRLPDSDTRRPILQAHADRLAAEYDA